MKKQKESKRYREQRNKLNADISESRQNALQKVGTFIKRPRKRKQNTLNINNNMSKKKIFDILNSVTEPPAPKPKLMPAELEILEPEILDKVPGFTLNELVVRTKIQKTDIKYYYDNGLLPELIKYKDESYWTFKTPAILKLVHSERSSGKSIKEIRDCLFPKKDKRNLNKKPTIHVQPRWQSERVINSQRLKFDATYKGGDYDFLDQIRIFRPLKYSGKKPGVNVVLHIPIQLNIKGGPKSHRNSDIDCLEKNLILFGQHKGFTGDLVISVNGFIDNEFIPDVKYLETINNTQIGPFNVIVFQRPNFGYQWGGFYDVWQKYKDSEIAYYITLECDCYLTRDWYKICIENIKNNGFVGMPPKRDMGGRTDMYFFTSRIWRNGADKKLNKPGADYRKVMTHTRGGFYFCQRSALEKLDKIYGCFTDSMGCDSSIDGVAMGEIGFASKIGQIGMTFKDYENIVFCTENVGGFPKDLIL